MRRALNFREYLDQREATVKMLVYGQNYIIFFRVSDDVYGGGEDARLTYATMVHDDEEDGTDEMVFGARNLTSELHGKPQDGYFTHDNIKELQVISNKKAEMLLLRQTSES
jgi:hypothetical protein